MRIQDFEIERYFAKYEFSTQHLLCCSDCDGFRVSDILQFATADERHHWEHLQLSYTETQGSTPLRAAIAGLYASISTDEILVASPGEANFVLMNVLLEQGDEVICMAPMYQSLYEVAQSIGCKVVFWEPDNQIDWYYNPAQLQALVTSKTKLIIVNFPHNPTGYLPSLEDWDRIIDIARNQNIFLFSDEMYRGLVHDRHDEIPAACDRYHNAISLWGMAKSFGMAGLRIGWLASKNKAVLQKVEAFKDYLSICNSATSEYLATIALRHCDHFLEINLAKIRRNKAIFQAFALQNSTLMQFTPPRAGSTAFVQLKIAGSTMDYAEHLVRHTGIMLLPSETYNYGSGFCRIGFGREIMPAVLEIWQRWIEGKGV